jgi:hypothetical protein
MSCAEEMSSLLNVFNLSAFGQVVWATVDLIGIVLTIVWYMVVLYGLWKMKDVRYKATVRRYTQKELKQQVSDLQKEIEDLKKDLDYEVASTYRLAGIPILKFTKKEWIVGSDEWNRLDENSKDAILTRMCRF